ncbi:MAG TPA: M23 family metallopeptidase [Acidimicrobiales bacterium]
MAVLLARIRIPLLWAAAVFLVVGAFTRLPFWLPLVVLLVAFALYFRVGTVRRPPVTVGFPVRGRYRAVNSPADKVPSHGLHAYGQTYAIDLVPVPTGDGDVRVDGWVKVEPPTAYPGFGDPIVAPVDGVVVRAHDRARDHGSRMSWGALAYLLTVEAFAREVRGPKGILGNHLVLRVDDGADGAEASGDGAGTYVALAHLRQGSLRAGVGDRVRRGEVVAELGNSGNSSQPHIHLQVMDHPNLLLAAGLPMAFDGWPDGGMPDRSAPFVTP